MAQTAKSKTVLNNREKEKVKNVRKQRVTARRRALIEWQKSFRNYVDSLPSDVAADLHELFKLLSQTEDSAEKAEIGETINELLLPKSLIIEMEKDFPLDVESAAVRERLAKYRKKVGLEIKKRREELGLSQDQLADLVGISQSHVCRLETGVHVPTHVTIAKVAKALDVCPSKLDPGFQSKS